MAQANITYNTSNITVTQTLEEDSNNKFFGYYEYYEDSKEYLQTHQIILIAVCIGCFLLLTSLIVSCCKVPLRCGYRCRCGERTKWFLKALVYQIFFVYFVVEFLFKMFFKCLDCICPDTKLEDNKLSEDKPENKNKKFIEMRDE
jgi:hypothetical protein